MAPFLTTIFEETHLELHDFVRGFEREKREPC